MRIGIDVDGVLANFFKAYETLTIAVAGEDRFGDKKWPNQLPQTWNWPETFGYSKETMNQVWASIKRNPKFWVSMEPLPGVSSFLDSLEQLNRQNHEIYFITDRPGINAQRQTAAWLEEFPFSFPSVIISGPHARKGQIAKGLALDFYLDDKFENVMDVLGKSPSTRTYMLSYPYNNESDMQEQVKFQGGTIITKLEDFFLLEPVR